MPIFNKKQKNSYTLDYVMYILQNDLIDVLKVKKDLKGKLEVEKLLSKMLEIKPQFSQDQIDHLSKVTEQVITNINLSESDSVDEHVDFILEFVKLTMKDREVKALEKNYFSIQHRKQNENRINKEISILESLIDKHKKQKADVESKLDAIKNYARQNQDKLKNNPTELRNVRKAIERSEVSKQRADQQIGVLNQQVFGKRSELTILNQAQEVSVIESLISDVGGLVNIKTDTEVRLETIVRDGDYLDELDKLNQDQLIKTNTVEDSEFLNDWLGSQPKETKQDTEEKTEESFEDFLKSLN